MDREHPRIRISEVQGDIGRAAQMVFRQRRDVRIDIVMQPATNRDPDPLNDMVVGHVDRVMIMRKYLHAAQSVDLLDRDHICVQLVGVLGQSGEVFVGAWDTSREIVTGGRSAGCQPVQVPGGDPEFRGRALERKKYDQQRCKMCFISAVPLWVDYRNPGVPASS